ncbi:MAG TPA: diguanylate cyclase [Usitatibacter sp.]|nr:diguanylate cyclase [Usitatibacter sp.]
MDAFRPLASSLVRRIVVVTVACAVVAAAVQASLTIRDEREAFDRAIANIAQTNVPLLSVSLWDIEPEAIRRQLAHIAGQPEISYVRLSERTGHRFEAGSAVLRDANARSLDIPYPDGRIGSIGRLEVSANPQTLYRHVAGKVGFLVGGYAALGFALCALIALMLRMEVEQPMRRLARFTAELTPDRLTTPLALERKPRPWRDEIDLVAEGFRKLQDGIQGHVANLDAQVASRTAQLQAALDEIRALTVTDALTGCFNRRHLDARLAEETLRRHRSGYPLAIIVSDIDHFKKVNDTLGHAAGDTVLRGVAEVFKEAMRQRVDWVARYGGEEFVIVLPDTDLARAAAIAERLRVAIERTSFTHAGTEINVTASFGVAECGDGDDAHGLIERADAMLYRAKQSGRNRVVTSDAQTV